MSISLWQLFNEDCRKTMKDTDISQIAAVVTDPPYGIKAKPSKGARRWSTRTMEAIAGDESLDLAKLVYKWCKRNELPLVMFYSPHLPAPGKFKSVLCWDKGHVGMPGDTVRAWKRTFELIGVAFNGPLNGAQDPSVLRFRGLIGAKQKATTHFCEKPVDLMTYLIRKIIAPGEKRFVFDPFAGSGSTLVACTNLGVRSFGCEVDKSWHAKAVKRLSRLGHPRRRLFEET